MEIQSKIACRGETPRPEHSRPPAVGTGAREHIHGRRGRLESTAMSESSRTRRTIAPTHALGGNLGTLGLAALGVVFGDIGTSPLYTLHECTMPEHGAAPTPENILGV